jgi:DNA-binding transcriptional LysR family regulator
MKILHGFFMACILEFEPETGTQATDKVVGLRPAKVAGMAMTTYQNDLEFSLLRTFLAVIRYGSMGRAATAVCRTQPAVSQQMLRLEKLIGKKVFSRTRGGVKLTRHGEMLVPYANRALDLNEEALARLREESPSGLVRLGVSEDTALAGLTSTLKRLQSSHPDVSLEISVAGPAKLDLRLAKGELDFVIANPNSVAATSVMEWQARPAWFASTELSIDPFRTLPLVLWQSPGSWHDGILDSLSRSGWEWRVVFESTSLDAALAAVESGLGVAALLRETVRNSGIEEIKNVRLPVLPEVRFAMFRGSSTSTRAQALMEAALATSLKAANGNILHGYPSTVLPVEDGHRQLPDHV